MSSISKRIEIAGPGDISLGTGKHMSWSASWERFDAAALWYGEGRPAEEFDIESPRRNANGYTDLQQDMLDSR